MKLNPIAIIALFLACVIGWSLGSLKIPYLERDSSYLLGLAAGLSLGLLIFIYQRSDQHKSTIFSILFSSLILCLVIGITYLWMENRQFRERSYIENEKLQQHNDFIIADLRAKANVILDSTIWRLSEEHRKNGIVSSESIDQLKVVNRTFAPTEIQYSDQYTIKTSPERGQMLLLIKALNLDSLSFSRIINTISFEYADLRNADLEGSHLEGINLKNAMLQESNLNHVNLSNAIISDANFEKTTMKGAVLRNTDATNSNFQWANLDSATIVNSTFHKSLMQNSTLNHTQILNSNFNRTVLSYAKICNAEIKGGNWDYSFLNKASVKGSNFENTQMVGVNLSETNMEETHFENVNLDFAYVNDLNWFELLADYGVVNHEKIKQTYAIQDNEKEPFYLRLFIRQ
ncbi:pentapeptide repeat-containing protein [Portibacter marinus]|uniref:pentapeptide repeat-containing protein n=1 Tax=Portibacter marinus TaxID=2898660 RepID=UPI001F1DAF14|nr:pentapeptide repeat-containing protein [Portibacter marinus]